LYLGNRLVLREPSGVDGVRRHHGLPGHVRIPGCPLSARAVADADMF
jgi:hypothetical protein